MESTSQSMDVDDIFKRLLPDVADFEIDKSIVSKHDQIFKSFRYRSRRPDTPSSKSTHANRSASETNFQKQKSNTKAEVIDFYIDKGPASEGSTNGHEPVEVFSVDLSNIEQSDNESATEIQEERVVSEDNDPMVDNDVDSIKQYSRRAKRKEKRKLKKSTGNLSTGLHTNISEGDIYLNVDPLAQPGNIQMDKTQKGQEPEIMKKSVITNDFENQEAIETSHKSVRQLKKQRKLEREKTKGDKWFHMPATEMTEERKNDYEVIQMRKALDPKRFYKANDFKVAPKYFQFGEVVESAADFYSSRIPKKQRKATVVEELLADAQFRQYNKRKYEEIQEAKRQGQGPYKHMKRMKKKKR